MSKKEINQAWVMKMLYKREITQQEAAEICSLSTRQIRRKLKKYLQMGEVGLIHQSRGKTSNRKISLNIIEDIVLLIKTKYFDFGPTLASEKLLENHDIKIDHETLRRVMIKNGLHVLKKKKAVKRTWREPKHHKGELVQLDGSDHVWFGNERSTLIVFIDDATKELFCRFAKESTEGVVATFLQYIKKYGRPLKLYTDRGKVFKVNNAKDNQKRETQFSRMLKELDIGITYAYSPQAKGRVERVNRTLQDRLEKELRLLNISSIDQANAMLDKFLDNFNKKFMVQPKKQESFFRSLETYDLNSILCYKYKRILNNDYTLQYKNRWLQLEKKQPLVLYAKDKIDIFEAFDGTVSLLKNNKKLNFKEIQKPIKQIVKDTDKFDKHDVIRKPRSNHPWNNSTIFDKPKPDISNESKRGHF